MKDNKYDKRRYQGIEKHDVLDRIGDSFSAAFSRRSRRNDKDDDVLAEFSSRQGDDYELFVDERVQRKREKSYQKAQKKYTRKTQVKKPVSPTVRKIRNTITSCVIVAVVLVICVVLSLTVLFKTQNYEITGNTKYTEEELIKACGIGGRENIFLANKNAAERKLIKKYAYIEGVDVSFAIPDTITIDITEAVPSYIVKVADSNFFIASSKGRILEKVENADEYDLPMFLSGDVKAAEVGDYIEYENKSTLEFIEEIVTVFTDNGYTGITEIDATDTANITFTYDDRIKVKIGVPEDISYKVRTAMTIIVEKLDLNGTNTTEGELDVSNCNTTKKSYFREQSLIDFQVETTAPSQLQDDSTDNNEEDVEETEAPLSQDDWYLE